MIAQEEHVVDPAFTENFDMPKPSVGMAVLWFPGGLRNGRDPHVAYVLKPSTRNVVLKTIGGERKDSVRHIDDPKLRINEDHRQNGAWDFTEEYKTRNARWDEIEEQLASIDRRLRSAESRAAKAIHHAAAKEEKPE